MIIYLCFFLILCCLSFIELENIKIKNIIYLSVFIFSVILIGFRGIAGIDSKAYIDFYNSGGREYTDKGFIFIETICKFLKLDYNLYFLVIAFLSMFFLWESFIKINKNYIILGFLVYYIRFFFLRDFNQIRYGLAINICMFSIYFLKKNKLKFILLNLLAISMHKSLIIFLVLSPLFQLKISKKKIAFILGASFVISLSTYIFRDYVNKVLELFINKAYTVGEYGMGASKGYENPILYYQLFLLILILSLESYFKKNSEDYLIIKNIYLLSVIILVIFINWADLGGRLSSIFATVEVFIIPKLLDEAKNKKLVNTIIVFFFILMAYVNIFIRLGQRYDYFIN